MTVEKKLDGKKIKINGEEVYGDSSLKKKLPNGKSQSDVVRDYLKKLGKKVV